MTAGVLGVSTDRGSAQAIAPVVAELSRITDLKVDVVAPAAVHDLFRNSAATVSDPGGEFAAAPEPYVRRIFEQVQPRLVITGASRAKQRPPETAEQYAVLEARRRGVTSFCILDYWGMYRQSFGTSGDGVDLTLVPDWIGALDRRCRDDLVALGIPAERITITHNPWLDRLVKERVPAPHPVLQASGRRVLLVMQPLAPAPADASKEFWRSVLRTIESSLASLPGALRHRVIVWRHPAQQSDSFDRFFSAGHHNVDVIPVEERSAGILAHVDVLVTVHSTVAYEAAHYGTPCVSLRMGIADMAVSPMDELGLSRLVRSLDELGSFLRTVEPSARRAELLAKKPALLEQGLFFSDGKATARVVQHARHILNNS